MPRIVAGAYPGARRRGIERYGTGAAMSNHEAATTPNGRERPRVVFLGMRCAFSAPPLEALLGAGCDVRAVVVPGLPSGPAVRWRPPHPSGIVPLALSGQPSRSTLDALASEAGVPLLEIGNLTDSDVFDAMSGLSPDVIAVACFPWRIPRTVRELPRFGCLNVHPSLLPRWRGPEPIFWTFRAGDAVTGATAHIMDGGFDTGPVLLQERIAIPPGIDGDALERDLAVLGGQLLVRAIAGLAGGELAPVLQDSRHATFAPVPDDDDIVLDPSKPARRVFDFVRGAAPLWGPLTVVDPDTGQAWAIAGALDFDESAIQDAAVINSGRILSLRCNPGVIRVTECYVMDSAPLTSRNLI